MRKKLIEVALPLPEVNDASAYDKMPGIGPHPKGIHHWWARLPLPTARAVLFASVVDDPGEHPEKWPTEELQSIERERLFDVIRKLMGKRLHEHPEVYAEARSEMMKYCDDELPTVFDPFAGGGSIPLEASRLGFRTEAGDLNPVAVLLNICNLEIIPRHAERPPVNPEDRKKIGGTEGWRGAQGIAADVRYYARLVKRQAESQIGHLYPKERLSSDLGEGDVSVVALIWARTVSSPSPAAQGKHVPLISTYWLSNQKGQGFWLEPVVDKSKATYRFEIHSGRPKDRKAVDAGTKIARGAKFSCLLTDEPIKDSYVKSEAKAGRLGYYLLAVVAEGKRGRLYLPPSEFQSTTSRVSAPDSGVDEPLADDPRNIWCVGYGLTRFSQLFTPRQLTAMTTLSESIKGAVSQIRRDAQETRMPEKDAETYAREIMTFLALALDRCADFNNSLCRWSSTNQKVMNLFGRQAIPMVWDFAEANIMGESVGGWTTCSEYVADCVEVIAAGKAGQGHASQMDSARNQTNLNLLLVSTDPPYYDNISYAGLSDFFYVWLRRTLRDQYPDVFATVLVPKIPELTASPERFEGNKFKAKEHFELGFRHTFLSLREKMDPRFPLTVYYAFKQDDEESSSIDSSGSIKGVDLTTGWETLLEALITSGFQITGTWPVRASQKWRMLSMGSNALASYIVLACRPRPLDSGQIDRRSFVRHLKEALPPALRHLQQGNIAPVDFAQAAIGPGMAIYSSYGKVFESSGAPLSVRVALSLINQTLTEVLSEQEDEFDPETRWAIAWFEQHGFDAGEFGDAELLSKAKVTSIAGLQHSGLVYSRGGKVRLLPPTELSEKSTLSKGGQLTVWEVTHRVLRTYYYDEAGDLRTSEVLREFGIGGKHVRDLAYRLFDICERRKRSKEAQGYNALVLGWPEIIRMTRDGAGAATKERRLFEESEE